LFFRRETQEKYSRIFEQSTKEFDDICAKIQHHRCSRCRTVSLDHDTGREIDGIFMCSVCAGSSRNKIEDNVFPVWYNEDGVTQYTIPKELSCLTEGEKLLIQQVSVFVPLHHLKFGQMASRGHVVSFQQDMTALCQTLPRLPNNVETVRVIKRYKAEFGEIGTKTFSIRKKEVIEALVWLKQYNTEYRDITIVQSNLDWIVGDEAVLPASIATDTTVKDCLKNKNQEDRGPSEAQICDVQDEDEKERFYGLVQEWFDDKPKEKIMLFLKQ
jgi:hypothetical protein